MPDDYKELTEKVISCLKEIYDPEIPVNIFLLGLIYKIDFESYGNNLRCTIEMTLTSPGCPVADSLVSQVYEISNRVDGIYDMQVNIVFDPPWGPDKMSYEAKLELGLL